MRTLAEIAGNPGSVPGWDEEAEVASRLVLVATDGGLLRLCLSRISHQARWRRSTREPSTRWISVPNWTNS
jgi:hypothetical protein